VFSISENFLRGKKDIAESEVSKAKISFLEENIEENAFKEDHIKVSIIK